MTDSDQTPSVSMYEVRTDVWTDVDSNTVNDGMVSAVQASAMPSAGEDAPLVNALRCQRRCREGSRRAS